MAMMDVLQNELAAHASRDARRSGRARGREEGEAADDQDDADQQADEQRPVVGKVPATAGRVFLAARMPAMASTGTIIEEAADHIATPSVRL